MANLRFLTVQVEGLVFEIYQENSITTALHS